jgi:hypothetical protein
MSFKNFINETLAQGAMPQKDLKSSYNKDEIVSHWKSLTATSMIPITPKPRDHYGTSLDEDTIRVTGSKEFIDSVMVRLKEFLQFDTSETELDVKYQASKYEHAGGLSPNFHFYCSVKYRDGNKKIPKGPIIRYGNY